MVPGETAIVPCAHAERTSMAEGTTAMGRTRMRDIGLLGCDDSWAPTVMPASALA
jgi:hypothetical protein